MPTTQNPTNKIHNSLDSSRPYGRLLENQKTGGSRELFLPENYFQASSTKVFPKKHLDFGGLDMKFRLYFFFTCPFTYELNIIKKLFWALNGNIFKVSEVLRVKFIKISRKG